MHTLQNLQLMVNESRAKKGKGHFFEDNNETFWHLLTIWLSWTLKISRSIFHTRILVVTHISESFWLNLCLYTRFLFFLEKWFQIYFFDGVPIIFFRKNSSGFAYPIIINDYCGDKKKEIKFCLGVVSWSALRFVLKAGCLYFYRENLSHSILLWAALSHGILFGSAEIFQKKSKKIIF